MSAASNPVLSQPEGFGKRLRHLAVGALFALVLLIPKINFYLFFLKKKKN